MEQKTKINAPEGKQDLTVIREFDLPVSLLFRAFEDKDLLGQWMGTTVLELNNQKHGFYAFETTNNGKVLFRANGTIHDFKPNERIVRTFEMENSGMDVQLEFLDFEKLTDETSRLTIHSIYKSVEHRAMQFKMPFEYGVNMAHNKLQEILSAYK